MVYINGSKTWIALVSVGINKRIPVRFIAKDLEEAKAKAEETFPGYDIKWEVEELGKKGE